MLKVLDTKELSLDARPAIGRRLAESVPPMIGFKQVFSRLNGWVLSLALHGGVAAFAAVSLFSVQIGGSGRSGDGALGMRGAAEAYPATFREEESVVSGTVLPDIAQYPKLTSQDQPPEPLAEELPAPTVPFDVFAFSAAEPQPAIPEPVLDPPSTRPTCSDGRTVKLPPSIDEGDGGTDGSGGGDSTGNGRGEGSGDGNATGVHTPPPVYPSEARRRHLEGTVRVELAIAADGSCELRRIVESCGYAPFEIAVRNAVKKWKYRPAEEDGRPELITKLIRFTFKLNR